MTPPDGRLTAQKRRSRRATTIQDRVRYILSTAHSNVHPGSFQWTALYRRIYQYLQTQQDTFFALFDRQRNRHYRINRRNQTHFDDDYCSQSDTDAPNDIDTYIQDLSDENFVPTNDDANNDDQQYNPTNDTITHFFNMSQQQTALLPTPTKDVIIEVYTPTNEYDAQESKGNAHDSDNDDGDDDNDNDDSKHDYENEFVSEGGECGELKEGLSTSDDDDQIEGLDEREDGENVVYILPKAYNYSNAPIFSYGKDWPDDIEPEFKHLKEEMINNPYAPISDQTWNGILKKCKKTLQGKFCSKRKNKWSQILRTNKVSMKHLVALKLYTDFDLLQREFRKSFRFPYNKDKKRLKTFYHWRQALRETYAKFSTIDAIMCQPRVVYHGVNTVMCIDQFDGTFFGPCSGTTDLHVARSFAGKNGMILVMKQKQSKYKVLDISWISDYPDEREILLFDHEVHVESWLLSSDYDENYAYYHDKLEGKQQIMMDPHGHISYRSQQEISIRFSKLSSLIINEELTPKETNKKTETLSNKTKLKKHIDFDKSTFAKTEPALSDKDKIDLLYWLYQLAKKDMERQRSKESVSKFAHSLHENVHHLMKEIHTIQVPKNMVNAFMTHLKDNTGDESSAYLVRAVFNGFFRSTYVPFVAC